MSRIHSTSSSTTSKAADKPAKPYPDFPLFPHATKRWAKKIRGQLVYFGPWSDPDGALARYLDNKEALHAGRTPRPDPADATLVEICNHFLTHKEGLVQSGELSPISWAQYKHTFEIMLKVLGRRRAVADLQSIDFAELRRVMAQRYGPVTLKVRMQKIRTLFKFAVDADLIARPVKFGAGFVRPSAAVIRRHRNLQGPNLFTVDEVRQFLIEADGDIFLPLLFLGINCGF